jgi:hypothetical protein
MEVRITSRSKYLLITQVTQELIFCIETVRRNTNLNFWPIFRYEIV